MRYRTPIATLLLIAACTQAPAPANGAGATAVSFETIAQRSIPGETGPTRREVFRDEAAWRAAWEELHTGDPLPKVDFAHEMVILAAMEMQSCVSKVTIRSVTRTDDALVVDLLEAPPAPNCVCITGERPIHAIRLDRSDLPARFEVEQGVTSCG